MAFQLGRQQLLTWGDGVLGAALLVLLLILLLRRLNMHQAALLRQLKEPKEGLSDQRAETPFPSSALCTYGKVFLKNTKGCAMQVIWIAFT